MSILFSFYFFSGWRRQSAVSFLPSRLGFFLLFEMASVPKNPPPLISIDEDSDIVIKSEVYHFDDRAATKKLILNRNPNLLSGSSNVNLN